MRVKIMPFLSKKGNRVAKGAIEFDGEFNAATNILAGGMLIGFTICDDEKKGLFVLFPSSIVKRGEDTRPYFFLRPNDTGFLERVENAILDQYESMVAFNTPRVRSLAGSKAVTEDTTVQ